MRLLITIALCVAAGTAQEAGRSRTLLTNRDIETLASAGFSEEFITQLIGASRVEFDTSAGAIADLKVHGINEDVIRTMLGARAPASGAAKPEFSRTQPIRVYVQASPDPRKSESHSQTAEIVHTFAVNCPSLTVTSRKETAAFLIVLERASGRLLKPATNRMVVFDRGGDTVYGSQLALPKAVRGFCPLAENLASTQADEGLPGSRTPGAVIAMRRLLSSGFLMALAVARCPAVDIRTLELPWAVVNTEYRFLIETDADGRCPGSDVAVSLESGTLPRGLALRAGYLTGRAKETGRFQLTLRASNDCSSAVRPVELVVTGRPILRALPEEITCEYRAGEAAPAPVAVQVSASWPDLPYAMQIDAPWLTGKVRTGVTPAEGSGLAADLVSLGVDAKNLAPGIYRASVRFSTWMGANAPVVAFTLRVVGAK